MIVNPVTTVFILSLWIIKIRGNCLDAESNYLSQLTRDEFDFGYFYRTVEHYSFISYELRRAFIFSQNKKFNEYHVSLGKDGQKISVTKAIENLMEQIQLNLQNLHRGDAKCVNLLKKIASAVKGILSAKENLKPSERNKSLQTVAELARKCNIHVENAIQLLLSNVKRVEKSVGGLYKIEGMIGAKLEVTVDKNIRVRRVKRAAKHAMMKPSNPPRKGSHSSKRKGNRSFKSEKLTVSEPSAYDTYFARRSALKDTSTNSLLNVQASLNAAANVYLSIRNVLQGLEKQSSDMSKRKLGLGDFIDNSQLINFLGRANFLNIAMQSLHIFGRKAVSQGKATIKYTNHDQIDHVEKKYQGERKTAKKLISKSLQAYKIELSIATKTLQKCQNVGKDESDTNSDSAED